MNAKLTLEFYLNKQNSLTVFCLEPDIQFRKSAGLGYRPLTLEAWFSPLKHYTEVFKEFLENSIAGLRQFIPAAKDRWVFSANSDKLISISI